MKIEILSKEHIRPSSPTPSHLRDFKLSFFDETIPPSYIPLILYYKFDERTNIDKSEMSCRLKTTLADALVKFYPLAGRMNGQILVDCSDQGILYVEADADGNVSDVVGCTDCSILDMLVPFKSNGYLSSAEEQVAIQTTIFNCGGIAIGICISHRISDASTLCSFIKCWAAIACGDHNKVFSPVFNSATLFPPRDTPEFKPNFKSPCVQPPLVKHVMKRFTFTSSTIDDLKLQVSKNSSIVKPTRVEVLSAFLWNRLLVAKGCETVGKSVAYHPVSLRGKITDLSEHSFGNIFQMISAENIGQANWIDLAVKLRVAFGKIDSEYVNKLLGEKGSKLAKENFMEISKYLRLGNYEVLRFSSYCGFPINETDFGWGKPIWLSSASISIKNTIYMFDSIESTEGVDVWIVMADEEMERLLHDLESQFKVY